MELPDLPNDNENPSEEEEDFLAGKCRKGSEAKGSSAVMPCKKGEDSGRTSNNNEASSKRHVVDGMTRCSRQSSYDTNSEMSNDELKQRFQEVTEEVDVLRTELEASQRQMEGKDEALKILQGLAVFDKATSHTKCMLQKTEGERRALEKEINTLQWQLEFEHNRIKYLEESWREKYERIHCENMVLKETLELRTNEVKTLKSENTILNQQCLEILAMLDVEQQNIFHENMSINKTGLTDITAIELAVLGACNCAGEDPCACAKMSATTRKQLLHLKQEVELEKKNKDEAFIMADAFRIAFEQQLKRRNDQTLRMSEVDRICRKESRRLKNWKRIMEDGALFAKGNKDKESLGKKLIGMLISVADYRKLEELDDPQEIIKILIDLLNDKEEALAHQRKVSYMLSRAMEEKVKDTKPSNGTHPPEECPAVRNHQTEGCDSKAPTAFTCCCLHKAVNSFYTVQSKSIMKKSLRTLKKSRSLPSRILLCSETETLLNSQIVVECGHKEH
ncbi:hypothetical protein NDU88_004412 [Pleurodeles waltl]|uniref:Coiled-coil domain-containing protein 125 n=1 Tax=Pleurodeles waltl TaxID=8319 RepID=A0AAV7W906_PLEWA|nr:hypothetical protein NDU88_004412 [Pleurodeles waltl]